MNKKVAVLFSGGLDSTYLVWKNLKDGNEVQPIYIEIQNNRVKTILEKNRIELLYEEFAKEFNGIEWNSEKIHRINYAVQTLVNINEYRLFFKQIPIWIFAMTFLQSLSVDEIQIGYVANDDAISYLKEIENIYKSYQVICESPMIKLKFPIIKMKKWQMAKELPEKYLDLTFSCENAHIIGSEDAKIIEYMPCCECDPCKKIISTNYYETNRFPEAYKKMIFNKHIDAIYCENYRVVDYQGNDYFDIQMPKQNEKNLPYQLELPFDDIEVPATAMVMQKNIVVK